MTVWVPTDDGHADLASHDTFTDGPPHNTFARMRKEDPLSWIDWDGSWGRGSSKIAKNEIQNTLETAYKKSCVNTY